VKELSKAEIERLSLEETLGRDEEIAAGKVLFLPPGDEVLKDARLGLPPA
jgi:hypothetical protein